MAARGMQRAQERIVALAGEGRDLVTLWRGASEILTPVVPHYGGACWYTLDPASLLITSHFNDHMPQFPPEMLAHEYYGDDVNQLVDVVRSPSGISTLHEATGGDPSGSPRWQANIELGGDQELILALRTTAGDVWGGLGLYRETGEPMFDRDEIAFLRAISSALGEGARRALLLGEATDPESPESPGLLVLSADWEVESATPGVERWMSDLPGGDWDAGRLPTVVLSIAGRALRSSEGREQPGEVAVARVLTESGTWVVLHGATLVSDASRRVAVIVEPAHPARIAPLLMSAYGLTERERDVTRLVLQGESTAAIAERLVVSAHTVQQHLKSIFEKTGVHSRRDLVGKVFFSYYEPRLRDNEARVPQDKPLRGGPLAPG
ncbi:MAG TPA: helix-turn-helix transcriptional regulator [Solirubrobacteraceae bacterium]|nr:helix-turn-helix transcriptional regulator [Solirubrobacteraceae bacterium]